MARILVVEDDIGQLDIRRQILENAGYEVVTAETTDQAMERLEGCRVVVMDLQIPTSEDGLKLIEAASGSHRIIVLSGALPEEALNVDEFLTKPFSSKKLVETIAKWISESK